MKLAARNRRALTLGVGVCSLALLLSCGVRHPVGEALIGPSGGTVELGDTTATLQVPAGALESDATISITRPHEGQLPRGGVPGTLVELHPAGLGFAKPAILTLSYPSLPAQDTTWLRLVQLRADGTFGATLLVVHDPSTQTLSAKITKTGQYLLADLKLANATLTTTQKPISDVDVLFVVDNSNSMSEEQQNLAQNFPKLVQKLEQAKLSYRIGVVSTDLGAGSYGIQTCQTPGGDGGKLQTKSCTQVNGKWIEKNIDGTSNVVGGDVSGAFSCMAKLGIGGCGYEHSLESARRALDPKLGINAGFVRKDAALAVVLLTDEDDCSAAKTSLFDTSDTSLTGPLGPLSSFRCFEFGVKCDINDRTQIGPRKSCAPAQTWLQDAGGYASFFKGLKPSGRLVFSAIAGPVEPVEVVMESGNPTLKASCTSSAGKASPAIRIKAVAEGLGGMGHFNSGKDASGKSVTASICSSDFSPALAHLGDLVTTQTLASWCLPYNPADTNPLTSEIEGDCVVVASKAGKLPACSAASTSACYSIHKSTGCTGSSSVLKVENIAPADLGDSVYAICLVL